MHKLTIKSTGVAVITPFDADGAVDHDALGRIIHFLIEYTYHIRGRRWWSAHFGRKSRWRLLPPPATGLCQSSLKTKDKDFCSRQTARSQCPFLVGWRGSSLHRPCGQPAYDLALEEHDQNKQWSSRRDNCSHGKHYIPLFKCGAQKCCNARYHRLVVLA